MLLVTGFIGVTDGLGDGFGEEEFVPLVWPAIHDRSMASITPGWAFLNVSSHSFTAALFPLERRAFTGVTSYPCCPSCLIISPAGILAVCGIGVALGVGKPGFGGFFVTFPGPGVVFGEGGVPVGAGCCNPWIQDEIVASL